MTTSTKNVEIRVERTIPATPAEVFDGWLDPAVPGAFGHENEQLIVDLKTDGLWYWRSLGGTPHYGRFIEIVRPARIQHSWMSPNTLGIESIVTVSFQKKENGTLMTILHSGLPNAEMAAAHEKGWNYIFDKFSNFSAGGLSRQQ
ncbi:MAG: SRPBCC domain-containing protein [Bradyrhizobiaceae bacterium]|nr:SRPBCC domain-containing protein [Bradyrhizobiaceae bacterium]